MMQFEALKELYTVTHALMLGGDTLVYLSDTTGKRFVALQHGRVIDQGRPTPALAKRFTEEATGGREVTRTAVDPASVTGRADA